MHRFTIAAAAALTAFLPAQDEGAETGAPKTQAETSSTGALVLEWPRDRDRRIVSVRGKDYTLGDLIEHIDRRHYHGMERLMDTVTGKGYLRTPLFAHWVRQFADVVALEAVAKERGITFEAAKDALSASLKRQFEQWLADYRAERERIGHPVEMTQERINLLLDEFQRDNGLRTEVQGWLDHLVPEIGLDETGRLRTWFENHVAWVGGTLDIAQIVIEDRDPVTLARKTDAARREALDRVGDLMERLAPDGSNFSDLARRFSDDRRTAREGGILRNVGRFDPRLPAAICRAAWALKDGEVSEPFESPYGIHIVKRLTFRMQFYVLFTDAAKPKIAELMRKAEQEDLLFETRERLAVELHY